MAAMIDNPLILREVRSRMRGNRAVLVQLAYLGLLAGVLVLAEAAIRSQDGGAAGLYGRRLFESLTLAQGLLVAVLAPAFAAGAFAGEREGQTLEGLLVSPLASRRIVWGKLGAATLFLAVLLTLSVPLLALTLLFGGVSVGEVIGVYVVHLANGVLLAALALGWSLVCGGTVMATVLTYVSVAFWLAISSAMGGSLANISALAAVGPLTAADSVAWPVPWAWNAPAWVVGAAGVLLLALWAADATTCRLARLRDHRDSVRPRLWPLVAAGALATLGAVSMRAADNRSGEMAASVLLMTFILGMLLAPLVAVHDAESETAEHVPWWAVWRVHADSSLLYLALVPVLGGAVVLIEGTREQVQWLPGALAAVPLLALALVNFGAVTRCLSRVLQARWTAVVLSGLLGVVLVTLGTLAPITDGHGEAVGAGLLWWLSAWLSPISGLAALVVPGEMPEAARALSTELAVSTACVQVAIAAGLSLVLRPTERPATSA